MRRENPVLHRLPACLSLALLVLAAAGVPTAADAATLWRKRGPNGEWVYYDRPAAGAEPYELAVQGPAAQRAAPVARAEPRLPGPTRDRPPLAGGPPRKVEILFPAQDAVIQFVDVSHLVARARIEPALNGGQQLWWLLNGQTLRGEAAQAALRVLPRGSHTLQARVTDVAGRGLMDSRPVVFHIRQPSAASPPVGPLLRKPPPPR
ncbi:MAG: hypothetical protein ACKO0U_05895 [Gammaproteobacteria bacterium]